jgi:hypothetical protein
VQFVGGSEVSLEAKEFAGGMDVPLDGIDIAADQCRLSD